MHDFESDKEEETERGCFEPERSNQSKEWWKHCRGVDGVGIQVTKLTTWSIMAAAVTGLPSKLLPVCIDQRGRVGGGEGGLGGELGG